MTAVISAEDDQRGCGKRWVDGAQMEERGDVRCQHHGDQHGETPETAKNVHAVRIRSATPSRSCIGHQPGNRLDGCGGHAHVEQPEVADDGQQHDPQSVGAGAQVAEEDPGEDQAHGQCQEQVAVTGGHVAGQLAAAGIGRRQMIRIGDRVGCAFAVHGPSYLGRFADHRDRGLQSSRRSAETKASWGTSTLPMFFIFFFPSFCFSRSLRFRVMSPP